jgi:hypothetical protein
MMWMRYFLEGRGYNVDECILHQDNMSAMLLETNGKQSSSKRTKHIRVRYFFINKGEITIKHCPTREMLADHFTKSLQGALFRKLRTEIQGIPEGINEAELGWDREERKEHKKNDPSPQECVATKGNLDPRARNPGFREKYLLALHSKLRHDGSPESEVAPSGSEANRGVRREVASYAEALRGTRGK